MPFTGKATFSAGATLPEIAEDVSDIIGLVSPFETPLLDHLGDARRVARSTVHEWMEDSLFPNSDAIDQASFVPNALVATQFGVDHASRFRIGDLVQVLGSLEVMIVTATDSTTITVERAYGGTTRESLADNQKLVILGNAALEGSDRPSTRFTNRARRQNYTQIFTSSVEVSGSQLAVDAIGIADELDYQKQERLRELLRDLENCVINGTAAAADPQGTSTVRRTMNGLIRAIQTNRYEPGVSGFPNGGGSGDDLTEDILNLAMRLIWENASAHIDTIVVNGAQKRRINNFIGDNRGYLPKDTKFRELVSTYESDFGVAKVILSRWIPPDTVLLLDSSRIDVLPLAGRSFHFKKLASTGDSEVGQVIGEYTLEMRNEAAHGFITGLTI